MSAPRDEPSDEELMTDWELDFMASIALWEGDLTPAQEDKLAEIEAELEIRRKLWREGRAPRYVR